VVKKNDSRIKFPRIQLLVLDFDGVMTDDKVYVDEKGTESVRCSRSDGLGINLVRKRGVKVIVLSRERNPVVKSRCRKLKIPTFPGVENKLKVLERLVKIYRIKAERVCYIGNDITDIDCVKFAGIGCAVNNSHPLLLKNSDYVTRNKGGEGAIREICDLILLKCSE